MQQKMNYTFFILGIAAFFSGCKPDSSKSAADQPPVTGIEMRLSPGDSLNGRPVSWYLKHPDLYFGVRLYLNDSLILADNAQTHQLLDSIVSYSGELQPLYFMVLNKICKNAGHDLDHILGLSAMDMLYNHTAFCLKQLSTGGPDYFTGFISNEMYQQPNWQEQLRLYSDQLYSNISEDDDELKKELDYLLEGIVKDIEHMVRNS